jgi:hypothetical protein
MNYKRYINCNQLNIKETNLKNNFIKLEKNIKKQLELTC